MSYHFSANQFDREFNPKRLGNWEVGKWYPERPRQRLHKTRIIADDRGHLLPGIPRYSEQPHERYITAWDFPRKITRQFAQEVTAPPSRKVAAWVQQLREQPGEREDSGGGEKEVSKESRLKSLQECNASVPIPLGPLTEQKQENSLDGEDCKKSQVGVSGPVTGISSKESTPPITGKSTPPTASKTAPPTPPKSLSSIKSTSPPSSGTRESHPQAGTSEQAETHFARNKTSPTHSPEDRRSQSQEGGELVTQVPEEEREGKSAIGEIELEDEMENIKKANGTGLEVTGSAYALGSPPPGGQKSQKKQGPDGISPLASSYTPFLVAKQFAVENLRHHPLPDMVNDPNYRLMESQRMKYPGTILPVPPRATAVSIRHKKAGPTHCTKSSIFRTIKPPPENPLTALAPLGGKEEEEKPRKDYKPKITDMDLAIGWDICAPIKGDGQSAPAGTAPSVFAMVPLPSPPAEDCGSPGGCGTPSVDSSANSLSHQKGANHIEDAPCSSKQHTPPHTKPPSVPNSKPPTPPFYKPPFNQISKLSTPQDSKPPSAPNSKLSTPPNQRLNQYRNNVSLRSWERFGRPPVRKAWEEKENDSPNMIGESQNQFRGDEIKNCMANNTDLLPKVGNARKRRSQSSPNLTRNSVQPLLSGSNQHKACVACHDVSKPKPNTSPKNSETNGYKMAFKAGKPSNNRPMTAHPTGSGSTSLTSQQDLKVKVPKPRAPFARRSYSISTLAPPFSLWPGNHKRGGRDYPDHWRLASVYQHAYKPMPNRTRPLLATVYQ